MKKNILIRLRIIHGKTKNIYRSEVTNLTYIYKNYKVNVLDLVLDAINIQISNSI